ncbi:MULTISPECIES: GTP-binding protein [unclassified Saccharopolyspora]|uniref:CobW family GTP-binding protein n=1 Tax=Saccharopolyspora TaxID=1835 RepID=UPI00190DFB3E|nr:MULTISPECIES: GTP-binding protein [unclassified Saccharopolyspora]MBK0869538.1 GTP-binding protein [Saccharopolyspora sp. HNM0986]
MASGRTPVVLVAGFLGSGKTTLLNHLLATAGGTRIGVVVNDFGSINIDAMSVAGQVDSMVSLSNGCLCCAVDSSGLDAMLSKLAQADVDVIVVESSGLADPRELIRMLLGSAEPGISYGGLVEVVDAAEFDATRARHPEFAQHLQYADVVVLNKTDRVAELGELRASLAEYAPGTPVLETSQGRVDPDFLFDRAQRPVRDDIPRQLSFSDIVEHDDCHEHAHSAYQSVEFSSEQPMDPRALAAFLDDLPAGLYRIKGAVHFGIPGYRERFVLHAVGNYVRFLRTPWSAGEPRRTSLVLIGTGIDEAALHDGLAECRTGAPEEADEYAMLPVLRFTA